MNKKAQLSDVCATILIILLAMAATVCVALLIKPLVEDAAGYTPTPIRLSNQTGIDLCHNITMNPNVIASSEEGKLICTLPSKPQWDHTSNVQIRYEGDGE